MTDATAAEIAAEIRDDWTIDPETGRSNSSELFRELCGEVEAVIRQSAHGLIAGRADQVAGLIMAQLAHVHHLIPRETPAAVTKDDIIRIIPEKGPERVMRVSHVEHHIITLADTEEQEQ